MSFIGRDPRLKSIISEGDTIANLTAEPRKTGRLVYATDTQLFYFDDGTSLNAMTVITELNDIPNVDAPTPNDNDVLTYNAGTTNWEASTAGPTPAAPIHYARINGSAGASVAVQGQSQAGTFTVTRSSTGIFNVDFTSLGLTIIPAIIIKAHQNGATGTLVREYKTGESITDVDIRIIAGGSLTDLDFDILVAPLSTDAPSQSGQIMYAAKIQSGNTITNVNVSGWIDSVTKGGLPYVIDFTSLSFSEEPAFFATILDTGVSSDNNQAQFQFRDTTETQLQMTRIGSSGFGDTRNFDIIMVPQGTDDPATLGTTKWYSAITLDNDTIQTENVSGWLTSTAFSGGSYTLTYSGLTLSEPPAVLQNTYNPGGGFNGGDGGQRFHTSISVATGSSVVARADGSNAPVNTGFGNSNILVLPVDADSNYP